MTEEKFNPDDVQVDLGPGRVDSTWIALTGRTGIGKTLYMTGIVHSEVRDLLKKSSAPILLITNYRIYKLPESVTVFRTGSVREIMEKMKSCEHTGIRVIVAIDELNKTLGNRTSSTNMAKWLSAVAGDARKYGVEAFIFSTQGRKDSDSRFRVNCTYFARPRDRPNNLNIDNHPMAVWWKDSAEWDYDAMTSKRDIFGNKDYQYGVPIPSEYDLEYLRDAYDTTEVIAVELDPTVKEHEAPELTDRFVKWSESSEVRLYEMNKSDVKEMIRRWNYSAFDIPYSPAGEQVIYTELLKRGLLKEPKEFPNNIQPSLPESKPVSAQLSSGATEEKVTRVIEVRKQNLPPLPKKYAMEGFCCGKPQTNMYVHVKGKRHLENLKSVEAGVAETVVENERQRTD